MTHPHWPRQSSDCSRITRSPTCSGEPAMTWSTTASASRSWSSRSNGSTTRVRARSGSRSSPRAQRALSAARPDRVAPSACARPTKGCECSLVQSPFDGYDPASMKPTRGTILLIGWALLVAGVVCVFDRIIAGRGFEAFDAETYLAAGERLNAGHALYALAPGDRPILTNPAFYTYPLLSPPPIAVLWRALAALPAGWGIGLWWLACIGSVVGTLGVVFRRLPVLAGLSVLLFAPFVAWELESGNVDGLFFAGIAATWLLALRRRDVAAGALVGVMAGIKLWPVVLLLWFVGQSRWRA